MSERPQIQTPPPEELQKPHPQVEANQGARDRMIAASEFTHDAGTDFVERVARLSLDGQEWVQEKAETMVGHTISAGRTAVGGIRRALGSAREKASESWSDRKDKKVIGKRDSSAERKSKYERIAVESTAKSERDKHRSKFYRQLGGLLIAKVIGVDKVEAQGIANVVDKVVVRGPGGAWEKTEKIVEQVPAKNKFEEFVENRVHARARKLGEQRVLKSKSGKSSNQTAGIKPWLRQRQRLSEVKEQFRSKAITREDMERKQLRIKATKSSGFVTSTNRHGERVVQQVAKAGTTERNRTRVVKVEEFVTKKAGELLQEPGGIYGRDSVKAREKARKHREKADESKKEFELHEREVKERAKRKADREVRKKTDKEIRRVWKEAHREDARFDADANLARKKAEAKAALPRRIVKKLERKPTPTEVNPQFRWEGNRTRRIDSNNTSNN
ncbi:MAG TPA: hypothetical protein PKB09_00405 [Candidatus Saccharibacteria bacterium]|nr:hypothetical protein [Candidatus Saccharibacteria bacterium]